MGSVVDSKDEFVVLVTGFDAFRGEYPQNPSWEIAKLLPEFLPARPKTALETSQTAPRVRIVVYPEPIRVNYQVVRKLVPTLWDGQTQEGSAFKPPPRIDLVLHIGMAGPRIHYALEKIGRRDGYALPDVDDLYLGDSPQDRTDPAWPWFGVPAALESDIALDSVLERWRATAPADSDLRISLDAGRYLCDFIYFSSLAHLYRKSKETGGQDVRYRRSRVAFLHVPAAASPERVEAGRVLVVELIRALVDAEVEARAAIGPAAQKKPAAATEAASAPAKKSSDGDKWYCSDDE
ncbi:pyroglutamyl peptidase type [Ophiostoma piceae UAMH 11346]|uniref:Pyroglutamyl peptidase type n=1 Tax=Ophiostoma piceae (strain UAMH 11346) TaxID=1262450 RepID=S3CNY2_OPHP1|nr:pyroglutamyl peptidase type [Ophiostoma piceae UAMH 11346]